MPAAWFTIEPNDFAKERALRKFEVDAEFAGVGPKRLLLNARRLADDDHQTQLILLAMTENA